MSIPTAAVLEEGNTTHLHEMAAASSNQSDATLLCKMCLTTYSVEEGYKAHLSWCPAVHLSSFRKYIKSSFVPGKVFNCKMCDYDLLTELLPWPQYQSEIRCMTCGNAMQTDITLHIHSKDGLIFCGFCTLELKAEEVQKHAQIHHQLRSILFKICSLDCLQVQMRKQPQQGRVVNDLKMFICFSCMITVNSPHNIEAHLSAVHGIETKIFVRVACPICRTICWSGRKFRAHLKKQHGLRPEMYDKNLMDLAKDWVICDHCFLGFNSICKLAKHIGTTHFPLDEPPLTSVLRASTLISRDRTANSTRQCTRHWSRRSPNPRAAAGVSAETSGTASSSESDTEIPLLQGEKATMTHRWVKLDPSSPETEVKAESILEDDAAVVTCGHCLLTFPSCDDLRTHIGLDHFQLDVDESVIINKAQRCGGSSRKFSSADDSSTHTKTGGVLPDRTRFRCQECFLYFVTAHGLGRHISSFHVFKKEAVAHDPVHSQTVGDLAKYLKDTFKPQALFPCQHCDLPRATVLEVVKSFETDITCGNCARGFKSDLTCHIHELKGKYICGFCSARLEKADIKRHCQKHVNTRSYLADLCSGICVESAIKAWQAGKRNRHKCLTCFDASPNLKRLEDHLLTHRPKSEWSLCPYCSYRAPGSKLKVHIKTIHSKVINCPLCSITTIHLKSLESHFRLAHKNAKIPCLECDVVVTTPREYTSHVEEEHFSFHKCDVCRATFISKLAFANHQRLHEVVTTCINCLGEFPDALALSDHKKNCQRTFNCAHCQLIFPTLGLLRKHINVYHFVLQHELENPRVCPFCSATFYIQARLQHHIGSKHGTGHICEICGTSRKSKTLLSAHVKWAHITKATFACTQCDKAFKMKYHLDQHTFYNHTNIFPFTCSRCGNSFRRKKNMVEHKLKTCRVDKSSKS